MPHSAEKKILYICMGRYGDIIHASLYANQLLSKGYEIHWLTIPYYADVVRACCPNCRDMLYVCDPNDDWKDVPTKQIIVEYPGYGKYLSVQPGAREHHQEMLASGLGMLGYVRWIVESATGVVIDRNILDYATCTYDKPLEARIIARADTPLCIIAPETKSIKTLFDEKKILSLMDKYEEDYFVVVLTKDRYEGDQRIIDKNVFGISFLDCINLIRRCAIFIGQDSGLSWGALYSDCKKFIYHRPERVRQTNVMYHTIDESACDIMAHGEV